MAVSGLAMAEAAQADANASPALAGQILQVAGIDGGLIVHLGCGDGTLTAALRSGESYLVHGLDVDAANVEMALRRHSLLGAVWHGIGWSNSTHGDRPMPTTP